MIDPLPDEISIGDEKVGADAVAFMRDSDAAKVAFRLGGRHYVIQLAHPVDGPRADQLQRERWRQLVLLLKAKMVAISTGITTAEAEFLPHAMLPTGQTLLEHLGAHPDQLTTSGRLALPGGDR